MIVQRGYLTYIMKNLAKRDCPLKGKKTKRHASSLAFGEGNQKGLSF